MKINELNVSSNRAHKRVGRGISAGQGKTAGRGTKGQGSRAGKGRRPGFEGGQNPFMQRIPKLRGFRSFKTQTETAYTGELNLIKGTTADNLSLFEAGVLSSPYTRVKLVVRGEVTKKVTVKLQAASVKASEAIEKAGGNFVAVPQVMRAAKKTEDK